MPAVIAILGPTASGKSRVGMELAERVGGEIVNADALQVYRGFDLGTAKPTAAEQARVRHHLIDILDPEERYSAGEFARRARDAVADIEGRSKTAIVVGGSGLYLRALFSGISPIPAADPAVRRELSRRLAREGLPALVAELQRVDAETAARLGEGDTQRVLRALEVAHTSGRPLSSWIADQPFGERPLPALKVGLTVPRAILYDRIEGRVARMLEAGWVREVEGLLERGARPESPAFQAIGYRQIAHHLVDGWPLERALRETVQATRRFAKRQMTWFRKEPGVVWLDILDSRQRTAEILALTRR